MMSSDYENLRVYYELADWYERHSQAQMRDRFLLLAADTALSEGVPEEAERLRQRLLQHSPHHMLKPFASFAEAMRSPDVQGYINDLRHTYPPETAEQLLMSLRSEGEPDAEPEAPSPPAVSDVPVPANHAPARTPEPLKVYRVRDEGSRAGASPRPAAQPRPPASHKAAPPAPSVKPVSRTIPAAVPTRAATEAPAVARQPAAVAEPPAPRPALASRRDTTAQPKQARRRLRKPGRAEEKNNAEGSGGWVGVGLFVLALAAGAALGVYAFARPFIPAQWLP
jgi:hypothetical protein